MKRFMFFGVTLFVLLFPLTTPLLQSAEIEIVITATRDGEEVRKVPANVTVITAEEIKQSGANTIVDVLETQEGIYFRDLTGNPALSQIDLRGFGGDNPFGKTLILLDGRKLNRPDMASVNWLQIPLSNIERIEIVRGSSSVLYGDAAVAGVINIITKKGEGTPKVAASVTRGSYGLHDERVSLSGSEKKFSYAITGENFENLGYRERSETTSRSVGANLGYDLTDDIDVSLDLSFQRTDYQLPGALTAAQMEQDRTQYQPAGPNPWDLAHTDDDSSNEYQNAHLIIDSSLGDFGKLETGFLYGLKDIEMNMTSWTSFNDVKIGTFAITPKYILEQKISDHANKLVTGIDYYYETLDKDNYSTRERTTRTGITEIKKSSLGYYLRNEFNIFDELILAAGYRAETTEIGLTSETTASDDRKTHREQASELGLTYLIKEKSKIFAKASTVYRIPFIDEQISYYSPPSDTFYTDLEAEKGVNYEAGTMLYPIEDLMLGLTLYMINMKDEIISDSVTWEMKNLDKTRHEGAETSFSYALKDDAFFYGNFTYQTAEFRGGINKGKKVPLVPKRIANTGIEVSLPKNFMLCSEMHYVSNCYLGNDNNNNGERLDAHRTHDLFLRYKYKKCSSFFGTENLLNEKYSTAGYEGFSNNSYYPAQERTLKGGISLEF